MNFREEYKNSIEIMSPSAEQMARMKKNIMEQVKAPEKKAIPFKKIAYIGGAVAACAVISVAAINIVPRLSGNAGLSTENFAAADGAAYMDNADRATESSMESACADFDYTDSCDDMTNKADEDGTIATNTPVAGESANDAMEEAEGDSFSDYVTDENAGFVDQIIDNTCAPTATTSQITAASDNAVSELMFVISNDLETLILNDVKYIITDDLKSPSSGVLYSESLLAPDGTKYRIDYYGENYIILSRYSANGSFENMGSYKIAE